MVTVKQAIVEALKERGEPMHLREITQFVLNKTDRLRGKTPEMTVNSILSTDQRFKRVAKGTYTLEEWGQYRRLRKVKDIAYDVLSRSGKPLPLDKIVSAVLAERSLKPHAKSVTRNILRADNRFSEVERDLFATTRVAIGTSPRRSLLVNILEQPQLPQFDVSENQNQVPDDQQELSSSGEEVKTTPFNDINLKRWKDYDHIETDSLWIIGARDKEGGHQLDYHGNFVPQIATQTILRYTKKGEIVLDLFLGSGTTAIEASRRGRKCVGVELKQSLVDGVKEKVPPQHLNTSIFVFQGDSTTAETRNKVEETIASLDQKSAHLLILHPPYHDIIKFSDLRQDLCNAPSLQEFLHLFSQVAKNGYDLLAPGRFAALVIGDKYERGELVPLGFYCMEAMNNLGFKTKGIIVKNITGNERGKGKNSNLWRYRALVGGFYIFKHEYVIIFQKPKTRRSRKKREES